MPPVTIYSQENCYPCKATYRKADALGISYTVVDISQDHDAREYVMSLGYKQTPVVVAGDVHFSGYNPDRLKALLG